METNDEQKDFEVLESLLNESDKIQTESGDDGRHHRNGGAADRKPSDEKPVGLALLEALPQMDSAKQFKNLSLVIIFTALMSVNYIVPNVKLLVDYSGPAGNDRYVRMTLSYIIAPIFITTLINLAWYIDDDLIAKDESRKRASRKTWYIRIVCLVFQMGTVLRFAQSLYYGYKSKHTTGAEQTEYARKMSLMEKDATLLRSFTAFMQGVPQFALQLYILTQGPKNMTSKGISWQLLSIAGSLGAITWGAVSCDRILGSTSPEDVISDWRVIGMLLPWRLFTIAARMTVLALFSTLFPVYFGLGCVAHYAIMYLLIQHQKVATHNGTRSEVFLFLVGGIVYIITDLLVKYERSYHKYLAYYGTIFVENSIMLVVWFLYADTSSSTAVRCGIVLGVNATFLVGLLFLRLFYEFRHPSAPRYCLSRCCQDNLFLTVDVKSSSSDQKI